MPQAVLDRWLEDRAAIEDKDWPLVHELAHSAPGLFTGPVEARMDVEELGVRCVLSVLTEEERRAPSYRTRLTPVPMAMGARYEAPVPAMPTGERMVELADEDDAHITLDTFQRAVRAIHDALTHGARVLIHCKNGVSRSPIFACVYLIAAGRARTMRDALSLVRKDRACANPNDSFRALLKSYENELFLRGL